MASKRKRRAGSAGEANPIPMTPMIDVVFQLLIYFLVTFKPVDIIANLDVFTPSPEDKKEKLETPPNMIRVVIYPDGYTINDKPVDLTHLDQLLFKLAGIDRDQTILIMCTALSPHEKLVNVLDLCAKSGLRNLSVVSGN